MKRKISLLNLYSFLRSLSWYSSIGLIYHDPLFLDLDTSEMDQFATIVEGGGFSRHIQRVSLEDRLYSGEGRSFVGLAKRMLKWILKRFAIYVAGKALEEKFKKIFGVTGSIKDGLKKLLVEYLGFSELAAFWTVELASFVFGGI